MGEGDFDEERLRRNQTPCVFVCYQGIERSRIAVRLLKDIGCHNAEVFNGGMHSMQNLTVEKLCKLYPDGADFILIYDHVAGKGNIPTKQQMAIDACETLLSEAGLNYREIDTTQLKLYLSGQGVHDVAWQFNNA